MSDREKRIERLERVNQKLRGAIHGLSEETVRHMPRRDLLALQDALADDEAGDCPRCAEYRERVEALTNDNAKLYGWLNDCEQRAAGKAVTDEKPMSEMTAHELTVAMTRKHTPTGNDARRDALEAFERYVALKGWSADSDVKPYEDTVRRFITAPPTVPEALNIERTARYFIHYLPEHLKPERGSSLQPYMDALGAALGIAIAQHSEPGGNDGNS